MCPILLEIYQKHTNNLKKIVFIFLNNRREETESHRERENQSVSPGLRFSLLVVFFSIPVIRCFPYCHTGCSITSHKFLMSHSPVTFNCEGFLLQGQTWWWSRRWRVVATMDPGQARWQRPLLQWEFCGALEHQHHQWRVGAQPLSASTNNISYLENISMEFHCGTASGRGPNVNIYFHYLTKCYRKLSAQSKTQTRPGQLL